MRYSLVVVGVVDGSWFLEIQRHLSGAPLSSVGVYAFRVGTFSLFLALEIKEDKGADEGKSQDSA